MTTSTTSTTLGTPGCDCDGFAFLAATQARLNNNAFVDGSIGVNDGNSGWLRVGRRAFLGDGTIAAGRLVGLAANSSVYRVDATTLMKAPSAEIRDAFTSQLGFPLVTPFCPLPAFTCDAGNPVHVRPADSASLPGGTYGMLFVGDGAVLTLDAGATYTFCEVRVGRNAAIEAAGQATINVEDGIRIGAGSRLWTPSVVNDLPLVLNVGGSLVRLSQADVVEAAITAPNAKLRIQRAGALYGCFCSAELTTDKNVRLECVE
ncbi:MAG TPA: hypothetical protein VNO26_15660 [Candidatus Limnocylindria bacterium]|nr:hypothetical protein [Candidatus Limnocylindria bacterium]